MNRPIPWPVARRYDSDHLARIALPLGGIGTGTVSLGGRGDLRDWEVVNRPAKGFRPDIGFFALHARPQGAPPVTRLLEGPLDAADYDGAFGTAAPGHGLPRFRSCRFEAAYPLGQVCLEDPDVPLVVTLQAFNPLVPADTAASSLPVAVLRYRLANPGERPVEAAVCASLRNFIGSDGAHGAPCGNLIAYREAGGLRGLCYETHGVHPEAEQFGSLALATTASDVDYREAWPEGTWGTPLLDFWDGFSAAGRLKPRAPEPLDAPIGSLAARVTVPPGGEAAVTFLLTWRFPNRRSWTPANVGADPAGPVPAEDRVGNHYATLYRDAWDAAEQIAPRLPELERRTVEFLSALLESHLPAPVKEAALFNLSTLRSQTCFRTEDGRFFAFEGCGDHEGCCHGSCTHVWNYEQATAFLFGDWARSLRETEFLLGTREDGLMSFRINLPVARAQEWRLAAADGQMGCLMKLFRDWQLSGDDDLLRRLWPAARRALEFCWIPGGWDADADGVMEGCQHNTMDVEYFGPNPQMGVWYLGALRACQEMAAYLGDAEFAGRCRGLFDSGRAWLDAHLFNGEYYEHEVRPAGREADIAPGLRHESMGARDPANPDFQLGAGCLIDQLVGEYMAHVCALGPLVDPGHSRTTLASLMRYNFRERLSGHFNNMRTFALQEESAMLMATYPRGRRPARPFPYFNEVMTGFEYTVAAHMLYTGMVEEGERVIAAVRDRYDGRKRNPFDEAECGHHYGRAMASWAAVLALSGFHYSAVTGRLSFRPRTDGEDFRCLFSTGYAWGVFRQQRDSGDYDAVIEARGGSLTVLELGLPIGRARSVSVRLNEADLAATPERNSARLAERVRLAEGDRLTVHAKL